MSANPRILCRSSGRRWPFFLPAPAKAMAKIVSGLVLLGVFCLPHVLAGLFLLLRAVLLLLWLAAGDDHLGHVVRAWSETNTKGATFYSMEYTFREHGGDVVERMTLSKAEFEQVPPATRGRQQPPAKVPSDPAFAITVREFEFGPLRHVA